MASDPASETYVLVEFAAGLVGGAVAWVVGYLLAYVWVGPAFEDRIGTRLVGALADEDVTTDVVGWAFYNAHFVPTEVPGVLDVGRINLVAEADGGALTLLYLLPPVLLATAGAVGAAYAGATSTPIAGARAGAMTVAGYLPLCALGIAAFTVAVGGQLLRPDPVMGILLAGLGYPLAFGTLGGLGIALAATRWTGGRDRSQ